MSDSLTGRSVAGAAALQMGLSDRVTDGDVWAAALKLAIGNRRLGASFARGEPGNDV
jgi:enoyl-CoA hydratase/carnithine racemase